MGQLKKIDYTVDCKVRLDTFQSVGILQITFSDQKYSKVIYNYQVIRNKKRV